VSGPAGAVHRPVAGAPGAGTHPGGPSHPL